MLTRLSILLHACFYDPVSLVTMQCYSACGRGLEMLDKINGPKPHMKMLRSSRSSCLRSS